MVFYRKYRPQKISELDLESVRNKLTAILSSKNIPHAFLFAGPKGLGKTSSARILAKAINCEKEKREDTEPCNTCSACISITNGSAVDVLEIDAASNRGIDEIRDLRERIKFSPASLKKKIYIIDEVHMLTTEAFNALLKTLEEPPQHVVFILCTTETGKLPATITSRTFTVAFEKPSIEELKRSLTRIVEGEKIEVENGVLENIAELSDRAFRDGAKLLEELNLQAKGKKITLELLEKLYKTGSIETSVKKLIEATFKRDSNSALTIINNLASNNTDFKLTIEKMAGILHAILLEQFSSKQKELKETKRILELLDEAYKNLRGAVLPQLPLEIAIIEYSLETPTKSASIEVQPQSASKKDEVPKPNKQIEPSKTGVHLGGVQQDELKNLIDSVNKENKILAGLLRGCSIELTNGKSVIIKAPSNFHVGKLSEMKNIEIIEKILGKTVAIEVKS